MPDEAVPVTSTAIDKHRKNEKNDFFFALPFKRRNMQTMWLHKVAGMWATYMANVLALQNDKIT